MKLSTRPCAAPSLGGIANSPCANVFGVRFGPAAWMPDSTHNTLELTAPACVAASTPQYQFSGFVFVDSGRSGGGGGGSSSVNGLRNDSPNACADWSAGYRRERIPMSA